MGFIIVKDFILEILIKNSHHSNFIAEFCHAINLALEYIIKTVEELRGRTKEMK